MPSDAVMKAAHELFVKAKLNELACLAYMRLNSTFSIQNVIADVIARWAISEYDTTQDRKDLLAEIINEAFDIVEATPERE